MAEVNAPSLTIVEFLTARLDEAEVDIECDPYDARYRDLQFGLADIAAKRAIVARWVEAREASAGVAETFADDDSTRAKVERAGYGQAAAALAGVVRDLASVYSDHPDYKQEWKP